MSGHLCLKWNNHSSAFLKSISNIQVKGRYCDATIACQGKYFPVHRIILSTCSDYFDEIFERIQCQHPYIVFKDIEPREMELLLNYMYQGEVNVVQEMLPTLIKAAEALRVKGLAVPDDLPSNKDSCGKKRSNQSNDNPQPKRRSEDSRRRRRDSAELNLSNKDPLETNEMESYPNSETEGNISERVASLSSTDIDSNELQPKLIKEEPLDSCEYDDGSIPNESQTIGKEESIFVNFPATDESTTFKTEDNLSNEQPYEEQSSAWSDFGSGNAMPNLPPAEMSRQDDTNEMNRGWNFGASQRLELNQAVSSQASGAEGSVVSLSENVKPKENRKHLCPHCPYRSVRQGHIESHVRLKHTGERPFVCEVCPSKFAAKKDLVRHLGIHSDAKPYSCPHCDHKFKRRDSLRLHLRDRCKIILAEQMQ